MGQKNMDALKAVTRIMWMLNWPHPNNAYAQLLNEPMPTIDEVKSAIADAKAKSAAVGIST